MYSNIKDSVHGKNAIEKKKQDMKPRFVSMNDNNDREINFGVIEIGGNNKASTEESKVISIRTYSNLNTENSAEVYSERKPANNAWIICENKLFRLKGCVLEETSYSEKVDDMTTIEDGSVLLLQIQPCYIKRLLGNRVLNFAYPGSNTPQCIQAISDNTVIVLCEVNRPVFSSNKNDSKRKREVIQLDDNGVVQFRFHFQYDKDCMPIEIIVKNTSDMYILFKDAYYTPPASKIVRIDLKTKTLDEDTVFYGAIGMTVSSKFICNGLCFLSQVSRLL
ncbi:unnamed protein product [Mytilus edulis]|uniref:Uncharacterized protein n=1 Tax=Mytilus edulis TaxID=6550 RepID=A0A8S3SIL7_MYTED|nr:unnamed protein product [Mytilus edulis]